jgi:REP element-mobilizing transposase RayT
MHGPSPERDGRNMHSFTSILIHCVWSTKKREPFLNSDLRNRLWPYLGGVARENKMKALAIGGVADHVHMLISLPATLSVSKALQLLKGNSSRWIHETFPKLHAFNGRKDTARSALESPQSTQRCDISAIRRRIIESDHFARSS